MCGCGLDLISQDFRASVINCFFSENACARCEAVFIDIGLFMKVNILSHFANSLIFAMWLTKNVSVVSVCHLKFIPETNKVPW